MLIRRLSALLLLVLLAACAAGNGSSTPTPPGNSVSEPVTITFWHSWRGPAAQMLAELVLDYQRAHPGVTIRLEERPVAFLRSDYRQAVLDGGPPDLVMLNSNRAVGLLAESQLLQPLESLLPAGAESSFLPVALDGCRYQGKLFALPVALMTPVLFYNRANIPSRPPQNTTEWLEIARLERGKDPPRWGLAYNLTLDFTLPYLQAFGGAILDDAGQVVLGSSGAEGTRAWLAWLRDLRNRSRGGDLLAVEDHQSIAQAVQSGQARLMAVDWSSKLPLYRSIWGADAAVAPLPPLSLPGNDTPVPAVPLVQSEVLAINPRSALPHQKAAMELMLWLTSADAQQRLLRATWSCATCTLKQPTRGDVNFDGFEAAAELSEIAQRGQPASPLPAMEVSWPYLQELVRAVLDDRLPADEAVKRTSDQLCSLLRQEACR